MDVIELLPRLHYVRLPAGHVYLWRDPDGLSLIDTGLPGHTPGSVAVYLPRHQVLFTGDAAARRRDGTVICGVFNVDRAQAAASLRRLAGLDAAVACFGHGEPLTRAAAAGLRTASRHLPPGTARHPYRAGERDGGA